MEPKILFIQQSGNKIQRILEMVCEVFRFLQLNLLLPELGIKVYTHIFRDSSIRNLYSTFYSITTEIQYVIVLITTEKRRKAKKLSVLRLDLSFL